ncbi:alkaline shock response membrane anchor protein AmaP [Actinomycetaceae bacterium L2_0104]
MRKTAGSLNRTLLTIFGILLLLGGALWMALAAGLLSGIGSGWSAQDKPLSGAADALDAGWVPVAAIAVAVLLILLALWWLLRQIPRSHRSSTLRFHEDPAQGVTLVAPEVISDAIATHVEDLPHVTKATASLRGGRSEAKLLIDLTVNERADIPHLAQQISEQVLPSAIKVIGTPLADVGLIVNVTQQSRARDHVEIH